MPLSEHAQLHLLAGRRPRPDEPYAAGPGRGLRAPWTAADAELVVDPDHRRRGHGRALLAELERVAEARTDRGSGRTATSRPRSRWPPRSATEKVRELWQMQRPLTEPSPAAPKPLDGLRLRAFRPGEDEDAWLSVNARAFAHHPEQGGWTATDLAEREASDWFDPEGLLLAEVDDDQRWQPVAGFHWTKEHREPGSRADRRGLRARRRPGVPGSWARPGAHPRRAAAPALARPGRRSCSTSTATTRRPSRRTGGWGSSGWRWT